MSITKFNRGNFLFTDTERFETFKTLNELYCENGDAKHLVKGVYTYNSSYGKGSFIKSDGYNVSLPSHMNDIIEQIRLDNETVESINNGKIYFTIYTYELPEKYPKQIFYSVNFGEY